jgi:hypothetical protein
MFTTISAIIIVLVIIILFMIIFKRIAVSSEESALKTRCKTSVMAYAKINSLPGIPFLADSNADEANINCPTTYTTIASDTPNKMKREIANLMFDCWDNFGAGKLRLFRADDDKFCVVCSAFQFEDKTTKLAGLPGFLMTEKAPIVIDKRRPSYQEYLTGTQTNPGVVDQAKNSIDMGYLDGSKRYVVMFTYFKQSYWSKLKGALTGFVISATVVTVGTIIAVTATAVTFGTAAPIGVLIISASVVAGASLAGGGASGGTMSEGADWDANIVMSEYSPEALKAFGCGELPVSQMDEKFR